MQTQPSEPTPQDTNTETRDRRLRRHIVVGVLLGLSVVALLDSFVLESVWVPSSSMRPTLMPNERVYVWRLFREIRRGDIVVTDPVLGEDRSIKRVVALPGERVQLIDSWRVIVDGTSFDYGASEDGTDLRSEEAWQIRVAEEPRYHFQTVFAAEELALGPDEYFLLGDNRLESQDGRCYGPLRREHIQGVAKLVWYSYDLKVGRMRWDRWFTSL